MRLKDEADVLLRQRAVKGRVVDPSVIRTDTTVVETNIHYPTDSLLLWGACRVAARLLRRGRRVDPASCPYRCHDRKIKRLHQLRQQAGQARHRAPHGLLSRPAAEASGRAAGSSRALAP